MRTGKYDTKKRLEDENYRFHKAQVRQSRPVPSRVFGNNAYSPRDEVSNGGGIPGRNYYVSLSAVLFAHGGRRIPGL